MLCRQIFFAAAINEYANMLQNDDNKNEDQFIDSWVCAQNILE